MTFEDFVTATEIKDGLTVTSRVEELVSVMHDNKDVGLRNARQWVAVGNSIRATKKRECLDVFVNLDGLVYVGSWLAEALVVGNDSFDGAVEESVFALLEGLQNLSVERSRLVTSGIWVAVKKLVDYGSSRVQDQARKLVGSWNDTIVYDCSERDTKSCSKVHGDEMRVVAVSGESSGQKSTVNNEIHRLETADGVSLSGISEENKPDQDKGLELKDDKSNMNSSCANTRTETLNGSSTDEIMKEVQENSVEEQISVGETTGATGSSGLPSNAPLDTENSKEKQMDICGNLNGAVAVTSSSAGHAVVSSDSIIASMEVEKNSLLQSSLDSNEVSRNASETICGSKDVGIAHNRKDVPSLSNVINNQDSDNSSGLSGDHGRHRNVESDHMADHAEEKGKRDNRKRRIKRKKKRSSSRAMTVSQCLGAMDRSTADIDLGIVDALEVATRVALEVAKEVDSGEPSHSSSEYTTDESEQSDSQDSHAGSPSKGLSVGESHSFEEHHTEDGNVMGDKGKKPEDGIKNTDDVEESHVAEAAKSEVGREKSPCDFDLNQDFCSDETDVIMSDISTTATTSMSVSHSVSAFRMPGAAPLQLERTLSRKEVPSEDLREKQVISRGIDLNMVEVEDDQVEDITPWKQFPFLSSNSGSGSNSRSGESSHEANPPGSSRFSLDLNCTNEDDDMPPPSELKMFLSHNGQQSASPAPFAQQSGKEVSFDLNDRPHVFIDSRDQGPYYPWNTAHYGGQKIDEPVLSIMGTKVDVDRKDSVSQMASFLTNGKSLEPSAGMYMPRMGNSLGLAPGVSFPPAPMYGYNGLTGPPGLSMSSTPMYVPGTAIPYMVDSRGSPVMMPQIMGSSPYAQPPFPHQHMFMNLAGGSPSLNGSVRPNFDQSSGFGLEIGNREPTNLREFLSVERGRPMGEHSGEPSSSSSISIGGKRKEPETRWDFPPWR